MKAKLLTSALFPSLVSTFLSRCKGFSKKVFKKKTLKLNSKAASDIAFMDTATAIRSVKKVKRNIMGVPNYRNQKDEDIQIFIKTRHSKHEYIYKYV